MAKKTKKKSEKKAKTKKKDDSLFDIESIMGELKGFEKEVSVMTPESEERVPYILSFSNKALQKATGGIIGGRFVEISGDSQSGKSFLLYDLMVDCIRQGGAVLLADLESAFEPAYGRKVGLKQGSNFLYTRVRDIDQFFKLARKFVKAVRKKKKKKVPILIGADSYAGFKCKADIENEEAGKDPRGYMAMQKNAKFSQSLDSFTTYIDDYEVTFVLLNQTREDHTVMYGNSTYTLAENVIKFWCTQRLQGRLGKKITKKVKSITSSKDKKKQTGVTTYWKTIKNRRVEPNQEVEVQVLYRKGLLTYSGLAELLVNDGLVAPSKKSMPVVDEDGKPVMVKKKGKKNKEQKKEPVAGYKHLESGEWYEKIKELSTKHPEVLEPILTDIISDHDGLDEDETVEDSE